MGSARKAAVAALCAVWMPCVAAAETLAELLESRALESAVHPIAAEFLAGEGGAALTEQQRATARAQLERSLERQTNPLVLMMRGASGAMSTQSMERMRRSAQGGAAGGLAGGLLRSAIGLQAPSIDVDAEQAMRESQQAMAEPWVRGIGGARALAALGDAEAAARFYVACLQMLDGEWAPDACLEDIIGLGPRRGEVLLTWMLDNAAALSSSPLGLDGFAGDADEDDAMSGPTAQLKRAALEGLGALIGGGRLAPEARERAFAALVRHAEARDNDAYLLGVAEGFARSKDPRAVVWLERLAGRRVSLDVRQAAQRGLAVGFGDEDAIKALRRELDGRDEELSLRAAQVLYEIADEAAFEWAVNVITRRRTADAGGPDVRGQVVRDLVELGGDASRRALRAALDEGPRNDWLEAWVTVGLLELGDTAVLADVERSLTIDEWQLDPRGVRSIWRAIKPFLAYATQLAMSGGTAALSSSEQLRQVTSLIGNAVSSERSRHLSKLGQSQSLTAQLRWQAADAIGKVQPEGSLRMLGALLADPTPGVQSSAALALARSAVPEALPLMTASYEAALEAEPSSGHAPELRATLVRAAALRFPAAPATRGLLAKAAADPDPGVRFIALAAGQVGRE
jgi:HEAT repeat protein